MQNTMTDLEKMALVVFKGHVNLSVWEKRLSPSDKARRKSSSKKFIVEYRMPYTAESLGKVYGGQDGPVGRFWFVEAI